MRVIRWGSGVPMGSKVFDRGVHLECVVEFVLPQLDGSSVRGDLLDGHRLTILSKDKIDIAFSIESNSTLAILSRLCVGTVMEMDRDCPLRQGRHGVVVCQYRKRGAEQTKKHQRRFIHQSISLVCILPNYAVFPYQVRVSMKIYPALFVVNGSLAWWFVGWAGRYFSRY
jgi:hypothetical protein